MNLKNSFVLYLVKFLGAFCLLYFGTKAIIGLTVPVGYYSSFIDQYLDYPSLLRSSLLHGTRLLVGAFGYEAYLRDAYHVAIASGRGIHLAYDCYGYGVLSFWIAFIFANTGSVKKKTTWILGGCLLIWFINVCRLSLILIAINKSWQLSYNSNHHTYYNVIVYCFIFLMIWLFQRSEKKSMSRVSL